MNLTRLMAKHKRQRDALKRRQLQELAAARAARAVRPPVQSPVKSLEPAREEAYRRAGRGAKRAEVVAIVRQAKAVRKEGLWALFGGVRQAHSEEVAEDLK